ncbi:unnamed protein product [Psylliodes chrysocephalus]|uniref:Arrestin C-terminal-like domain-containing protein n=1 Tax=Psylliodes chrysocephalus TaxID=3402493 RepID=A0A9P0D7M5_9CUCU|nr:unnamed protein product [Psylliodes chrysocephala]
MTVCKIMLDTPGVLGPGSTIYGRVVCVFSSTVNIREIRCRLRGKEYTTVRQGKHTYEGLNVFLNMMLCLTGEGTIQSGQYEYRFSFTLPRHIPSTFHGEFGSIYYYLKATIDMALAFNYKDKITLRVTVPVDFNLIRHRLQLSPVIYQNEKTLCCWCCTSEPITLSLFVEKEAFTLGEIANVIVEIINMSNTNVEEFNLSLIRITEYLAEKDGGKHIKVKERLTNETVSGVGAHGQRTYRIDFLIPQTVPVYNFTSCCLIKQYFIIAAEATLPALHQNFSAYSTIELGHIPLMDTHSFQAAYVGIEVEDEDLNPEGLNPCAMF